MVLLWLLTVPATAGTTVHRLQLLHLVGCEDLRELIVRVLENGLGLFAALVLGEAGVAAKLGHLLLLGGEDRLKLGGLIGIEAELFAEVLGGLLGIHLAVAAMMSVLAGWLLGCGVA